VVIDVKSVGGNTVVVVVRAVVTVVVVSIVETADEVSVETTVRLVEATGQHAGCPVFSRSR
jgi:hypothetical protein